MSSAAGRRLQVSQRWLHPPWAGSLCPLYLEDNQGAALGVKGQVGPSLVLRGRGLQKLGGLIQDDCGSGVLRAVKCKTAQRALKNRKWVSVVLWAQVVGLYQTEGSDAKI